jgi:deoxyribonuclease-4
MAVDRALDVGCTTFQMFTRNPRGWAFRPLEEAQVALFREKRSKARFEKIVVHMPYLPNLATSIKAYQKRSRDSLAAEMSRCTALGVDYLVAHIGYHEGKGLAVGIRNVIDSCNHALERSEEETEGARGRGGAGGGRGAGGRGERKSRQTTLLIETAAGQKGAIGSRFEELRAIIDGIKQSERVGVCLDTCHVFAAGFDISNEAGVMRTMEMFDEIVGYERLKVVHLNDSKGKLGSHLDRHQFIGEGFVGTEGFRAFLHYGKNARLPLLMEIPVEDRKKDEENLALVKSLILLDE